MTAKIEPIIVIIDDQVYGLGGYYAALVRRVIGQEMGSNDANKNNPPAETVTGAADG